VKLGDIAAVYCEEKQKLEFAVVADTGPRNKIGEGSIALATSLGLPSDPRKAGTDKGITYVVFPQSGKIWPMTAQEIQQTGQRLFDQWGGVKRIKAASSPSPTAKPQPSNSRTSVIKPGPTPARSPDHTDAKTLTDIESRVRTLLVNQLGVNPERVVPAANIQTDLGADSLDLVELVMAAEEEFQIEIPDTDVESIKTVADACAYIQGHVK
jgi:acyl carrier protein